MLELRTKLIIYSLPYEIFYFKDISKIRLKRGTSLCPFYISSTTVSIQQVSEILNKILKPIAWQLVSKPIIWESTAISLVIYEDCHSVHQGLSFKDNVRGEECYVHHIGVFSGPQCSEVIWGFLESWMWPREICFAKYLVIEQKSDLLVNMELPISILHNLMLIQISRSTSLVFLRYSSLIKKAGYFLLIVLT